MNSETKVKQRPILFSTPMIQSILEDRKGMTRRALKVQPEPPRAIYSDDEAFPILQENGNDLLLRFNWKAERHGKVYTDSSFFDSRFKCPYGKVGDILWVRETWLYNDDINVPYAYKADFNQEGQDWHNGNWKPSIFMPRDACRLFLQITDIRVERLQDISEEDAQSEGVMQNRDGSWHDYIDPKRLCQDDAKASFISLWESINGAGSWNTNPFVWVVSFKQIDKPG